MSIQVQNFVPSMMMIMVILATTFSVVKSDPNTSINNLICNKQTYASDDPYGDNMAHVLADLMNVTPSQQGYNYYTQSPSSIAVAYGHATCSQALANSECANCMVSARDAVSSVCSGYIGGQVEMVDCSMRYESYPFE